ncbi:hypothetical protein [Subtercola lobariae]|uniref:Uncharacterized protein n=1 Tax=Subtercola lobariae TaxID=1588641 RepID=A0A917BFA8_9MICO|nr:hypothetical protein [Subtercola lobariae]GGF35998.1 hypothetical protein GCM10011399_31210 [Subtercola lobariae]
MDGKLLTCGDEEVARHDAGRISIGWSKMSASNWAEIVVGLAVAAGGVLLIVFRKAYAKFNAFSQGLFGPIGGPGARASTPGLYVVIGILLVLFGLGIVAGSVFLH